MIIHKYLFKVKGDNWSLNSLFKMVINLERIFYKTCCRFGLAALDTFHNHLSAGHYRPDIRRMHILVRKAQKRRLLFEERKRSFELAGQLLKSRESLLSNAYKQGFSQPANRTVSKPHWRKPKPVMGKCTCTHVNYT